MVDSLSQSSSWFTVDPDTYRYFFSASAQVFAAIFAVVAIAFSFKIMNIQSELENLRKERRRKIKVFESEVVYESFDDEVKSQMTPHSFNELKKEIWELDDWLIDRFLDAIQKRCVELIKVYRREQPINEILVKQSKKKYYSIGRTKAATKRLRNRHNEAILNVIKSVVLASAMVILSLLMLWSEWYKDYFVLITLPIFILVVYRITFLFVWTFSDSKPSFRSIFRILWDEVVPLKKGILSIPKMFTK
jgi:hypothetical protein